MSKDVYEIVEMGGDNFNHIKLGSGSPYIDTTFQFGAVKLTEEDGHLRVAFEYEVFSNKNKYNTDTQEFKHHIGEILVSNLEKILAQDKELNVD